MSCGLGVYVHKETGNRYIVRDDDVTIEHTMTRAVVYEDYNSGKVWVLPYGDFFDGRFERVSPDRIEKAPEDWDGTKL